MNSTEAIRRIIKEMKEKSRNRAFDSLRTLIHPCEAKPESGSIIGKGETKKRTRTSQGISS
jgi:ribosomal protein S20